MTSHTTMPEYGMTPELVCKLRKVLRLLGSDRPGEVVAAAEAAGRLLAAERMGWCDLAEALAPALPQIPSCGRFRDGSGAQSVAVAHQNR